MSFGFDIDTTLEEKDAELLGRYEEEGPWGLSSSIDLHQCDLALITDAEKIKQFLKELVEHLEMKTYGPPHVMNFGDNPRVAGISAFQFIETSSIVGHFANDSKSVYLDVFSCSPYPPHKAAAFCKRFFKAEKAHLQIAFRG
jgi:S-adenosylmethionine/arginine decarboxylase-like enzyme